MASKALLMLQLRASSAGTELRQLSQTRCVEQRHLDCGSPEQDYWHHGYNSAVIDVILALGLDLADIDGTAHIQRAIGPTH